MTRTVVLLALVGALVGLDCSGGAPAPVTLAANPTVIDMSVGTVQSFELRVQSSVAIQAFELGVQVDPPTAVVVGLVEPGAGFDDDGRLFLPPLMEPLAGRVSRVVDLRHGAAVPPGTWTAVRFSAYATTPGEATLRFTSPQFAKPDGTRVAAAAAPITIRVGAP